jgi:hypothetical protein
MKRTSRSKIEDALFIWGLTRLSRVWIKRFVLGQQFSKNRGPTRTPCLLYPQNSGFGATKPAHPGIRDSRTVYLHAQGHLCLDFEAKLSHVSTIT